MENIAEKVKEKLKGAKEKVASTTQERIGGSSSSTEKDRTFEEGGPGTEIGRKDDPLTEYSEKEPMTPAKIKEHEPTAVKREMTTYCRVRKRSSKSGSCKGKSQKKRYGKGNSWIC
jgi:hypothetical protein